MKQVQDIELGVFDINGTIHTPELGIPDEVVDGFGVLHDQYIETTVVTGRGISVARSLLGDHWDQIVSADLPVSVENGSRLVSSDEATERHHPLTTDELTEIVDRARKDISWLGHLAFYPKDIDGPLTVWHEDTADVQSRLAAAHQTELAVEPSLDRFLKKLATSGTSMVIIGGQDTDTERFPVSHVLENGDELNILHDGTTKATGALDIVEFAKDRLGRDIRLSGVMVAGNDHNDLGMLSLPVGRRLFVEGVPVELGDLEIERFASVIALGSYLGHAGAADDC